MSNYQIEDGIDVPPIVRGRQVNPPYPFAEMLVGQSFLVEVDTLVGMGEALDAELTRLEKNLRAAAMRYAKVEQGTVKFTIRQVPGGVRCWRIA